MRLQTKSSAPQKNRAFLKWAGGKYGLIQDIKKLLPEGNKLVEPFVGAGSVFLNTNFKSYLLNDINPDLVNLYQDLKQKPESYISDAESLFCARNNQEERFYQLRNEFNTTKDDYYKSILFLYLNRHGYNGLCRYNLSGGFNVPFGQYKAPYFPKKELYFFAEKSLKATFSCESYQQTFKRIRSNNVVYCDPPYAPISPTSNFTQYSKSGFSAADQQELAKLAMDTANRKNVTVLISNHDTQQTRDLYQEAKLTKLMVSRTISQKGHKRVKVSELMALYQSKEAPN